MSTPNATPTLQILSAQAANDQSAPPDGHLRIANDADVSALAFDRIACIELDFPKFTDGRAFSQAHVLRRLGFAGEIRATGDVLIDQLLQLQRSGFTSAVLREGQDAAHGQRLLAHYSGFYQGDVQNLPHFARAA